MCFLKRLTKSSDKMVDGVLGGFAEYFEIDPVWIRIGYFIFALATGFWIAFFIYIAGAIIIPRGDGEPVYKDVTEGKVTNHTRINLIIGLALIIVGALFLVDQLLRIDMWQYLHVIYNNGKYYAWAFIFIAFGLLIILKGRKKD